MSPGTAHFAATSSRRSVHIIIHWHTIPPLPPIHMYTRRGTHRYQKYQQLYQYPRTTLHLRISGFFMTVVRRTDACARFSSSDLDMIIKFEHVHGTLFCLRTVQLSASPNGSHATWKRTRRFDRPFPV